MSKDKKKSGLGKFVAGAAIGVGLGVLFAPKSGKETRRELKQKFDEFISKVKEIDVDEVKEMFEQKAEEIKQELADLDKVLKIAKKKGEQIKKKCQDLVNLAVVKGTPALEKAADGVRAKAIDVVSEVLYKLEQADENAKKKKEVE